MDYRIFDIYNGIQTNITPLVGDISWRDSIDTLGIQLDFNIANNDNGNIPKDILDIGHMIVLLGEKGNNEIFRGLPVTENKQGRQPIGYSCFDYGFYLNKSKEIYQFKKIKADVAIKKICTDFKIPIGSIISISTIINKIYYDKELSEIIKDILDIATKSTGIKYRMEFREGKFYIQKYTDMIIKASFDLGGTIQDITDFTSNPTRSRSIEEMKNSIKIYTGDENKIKVVATARDEKLIKEYGLLQEVQSVDEKDIAKAKNIANNLLKDLAKITEDNSIELIGNDDVRAGRILEINEPLTGMKGNYLIKDCTHTIKNGIHKMQVGLKVI